MIITTVLRNKLTETVYHISRREIVLSRFSLGSSVTDTSPLEQSDQVFSKLGGLKCISNYDHSRLKTKTP